MAKEVKLRINEQIKTPEVRVIFDEINEIMKTHEAMNIAKDNELDLVEIQPTVVPPVCKIIDYKKYLYDKKKNEKKPAYQEIKEIRMTPNIDENDIAFKSKHAVEFLKKNNKVKLVIFFKGREIAYKEKGEIVLLKFAENIQDHGTPEHLPKLEGKRMIMVVKPKK
jgi:translation initiation factor IF-3